MRIPLHDGAAMFSLLLLLDLEVLSHSLQFLSFPEEFLHVWFIRPRWHCAASPCGNRARGARACTRIWALKPTFFIVVCELEPSISFTSFPLFPVGDILLNLCIV
uniref:Secreted protein n=1 Tax=Opuntia streptacantha TaxID=393608 RepID=A0A7C8ZNY9_OPUST